MSAGVFQAFLDVVSRDPTSPALVLGADVWTYGDLAERSRRIATTLAGDGATPGCRVAAQVEKSPEGLALYLACLAGGFAFVPLNPAYGRSEVEYLLDDAEPTVVVCAPDRLEATAALAPDRCSVLTLGADGAGSAIAPSSPPLDPYLAGAGDLAAIVYTSGTTGRPKGAMLTHGNLLANARTLIELWQFTADDVLLHALPIYHVHGLFVASHCALLSGASMRFLPRFDAPAVLAGLGRSTVMMGVPTFYTRLLREPGLTREAVGSMRLFISGSAPLLAETFAFFERRTGHPILERYGMSETGMNASNPVDGDRIPGTVGPPLRDVDLRICDEHDAPVPDGEPGGVQVRGPNVFSGYWRRPERHDEDFTPDGFFRTGDIGRITARGYLEIVGRAKDLIITGGLNVYPKEIEERIDALPGVLESAVVGLPDPDFGERVVAVVVPLVGARLDSEGIIGALRADLAGFKVPKAVHIVDELPRNAMGKVQKNALRDRLTPELDS